MTTPFVGVQEDEPAGDHPGEDLDPIASLAYQGDVTVNTGATAPDLSGSVDP